jgi:molybdate transport system permease protein
MTRVRGRATLLILAGMATAIILVPLAGMLIKAPWSDWPRYLSDPIVWPAIRLSIITTLATVVISMILGTPLAWLLSRADGRAANWLRALVTVPVVLPPVVGGVALLLAYGRHGVVGSPLFDLFGLRLPFTPYAVVLAQVFVSMPFYVLSVEGAMRGVDQRYAQVASTLGSGPLRTFLQIGLPLAAPGIAAGAALAWARSLGEFGATITFAGNFAGETQTAPLAIYVALQGNPDAAVALSVAMLFVAVLILGLLRGQWMR